MRTTWLVLLLAALPLQLQAQQPRVVLRGRGDPALDARLRGLLRHPERTLWTRDTLIARNDTVREPLLVVGATVRVEGVLQSDVVAVGADLFVRPSARVQGRVLNIAGGWYASDLAVVSGELDNRPEAPYAVEHTDDALIIRGTRNPRVLSVAPMLPGYDRVNGFSPAASARLLLPAAGRLEPTLNAWAAYRTERGQLDGGASARFSRGETALEIGVERNTLTNDGWIRGTLFNAVVYLWDGTDIRDYYQADRSWVELRRGLERGERTTDVWLRGQTEDARSLRADRPWTLFKPDSVRPNRQVDEGRVTSLLAGSTVSWRRPTFETRLDGAAEFALDALDSDFTFATYRVDLDWAMLAFRDHTLEITAHAQGPLPGFDEGCTDCAGPAHLIPRQRWSHVGGVGTMYTFGNAAFQGDRVVFIESRYDIPLGPRLRLPFLGAPVFELVHDVGMAWTRAEKRAFEQNVGVQLSYNLAYVRLVSNPDDLAGDVQVSVGISLPQRAHPWQSAGGFF